MILFSLPVKLLQNVEIDQIPNAIHIFKAITGLNALTYVRTLCLRSGYMR